MSDPQVSGAGPDGGQVLYNLAMGAQPEDFHPALQPLAQGYSLLFQPQPAQAPGLLGSADDIQAALVQPSSASPPPAVATGDVGADAAPTDADDGEQDDDDQDDDETDDDQAGDDQIGDEPPAAADPVQRLKNAQDAALANKNYRPGPEKHISHCNQATYDIAQRAGADATPFGKGKAAYLANEQVQNLENAANTPGSGWKKIGLGEAQAYANQGKMAVLGWTDPAGGHGHTVTVMPKTNSIASNPTLAQIGGAPPGNGEHTFREAFGSKKRDAVGAYVYVGQ